MHCFGFKTDDSYSLTWRQVQLPSIALRNVVSITRLSTMIAPHDGLLLLSGYAFLAFQTTFAASNNNLKPNRETLLLLSISTGVESACWTTRGRLAPAVLQWMRSETCDALRHGPEWFVMKSMSCMEEFRESTMVFDVHPP